MLNHYLSHDLSNARGRDINRSIDVEAHRRIAIEARKSVSAPATVADIDRTVRTRQVSALTTMLETLCALGRGLVGVAMKHPTA